MPASTSSAPATSSISTRVADAVATITGAPVNERIPDEVLAAADEVELVDMSPFALRQRMRHGNVYPPERTAIALDRFFTESNLTALRELSLRFVAGRVDAQLEGIGTPIIAQPVTERVLVLVDGSRGDATGHPPRAPRRPRCSAHRSSRSSWTRPARAGASSEQVRRLREHLDDAVDLGAEVLNIEASDLVDGLVDLARRRRVTRLVLPYRAVRHAGPGPLEAARRAAPRTTARAGSDDRGRFRRAPPTPIAWVEATEPRTPPYPSVLPAGTPKYGLAPHDPSHTLFLAAGRTLPRVPRGFRDRRIRVKRGNDHMASMAVNELGPMLTATEVAEMLHLHVNTVKRLGDRGELPFYRVCKRGDRRFRLDDVMKFLSQNR